MSAENGAITKVLDFPTGDERLSWALVQDESTAAGDVLIASVETGAKPSVLGRFDAATGNVIATGEEGSNDPAVLNIGDPRGTTGQLKARQEKGNYLRVCRWDRLEAAPDLQPNARFRTLPQCGCGGYLGTPKFFDSFAEMSAYVFCMFFAPASAELAGAAGDSCRL